MGLFVAGSRQSAVVFGLLVTAASSAAFAEEPPKWWQLITVNAFIDGYDGYNDNFSRSLLFTFAIPFTHTGLKLSYAFNDKIAASVMLVNGWDNVLDNNSAKSFGVSVALTPVGPLAIYVNYI